MSDKLLTVRVRVNPPIVTSCVRVSDEDAARARALLERRSFTGLYRELLATPWVRLFWATCVLVGGLAAYCLVRYAPR